MIGVPGHDFRYTESVHIGWDPETPFLICALGDSEKKNQVIILSPFIYRDKALFYNLVVYILFDLKWNLK